MKLTIQSKQNAQTIINLFNTVVNGHAQEHGAKPLSIYDDDKHICFLVVEDGKPMLKLVIEREEGDIFAATYQMVEEAPR